MSAPSRARAKSKEIVALYKTGIGHKTIAARLGISPRIARVILIERGVYQPGKLKRLRGGPGSRDANAPERIAHLLQAHRKKIASHLRKMKERVRRCIDKHPPALSWMERYRSSPLHRVKHLLRKRIRNVLHRGDKLHTTMQLTGCTGAELIAHIERQFTSGMNWSNQGTGKKKWHIDHIFPCAAFDLTKQNEQRACFHFTNLRPMWSSENISKGARMTGMEREALEQLKFRFLVGA